ncbi:hypothetical protein A4S06_00310 [Erysipelotrichaceae bacterium MTC7]|nr:hypothetical protein A4S06_00310 [Erysipelotrichaceae bacterium MTC7]
MKVIRCINNNITLCLDNDNNEVVVFGKGIGFGKNLNDEIELSKIERTYYKVNPSYLNIVNHISETIIKIAIKITDYCRIMIDYPMNPNLVFTLADHIDFGIKRYKKDMDISLPIMKDIEHLYEKEYDVGLFALKIIKNELGVSLPKQEAGMIALHIINAGAQAENNEDKKNEEMIEDIIDIIQRYYDIKINTDELNYSRFVSHMSYLFIRGKKKKFMSSKNLEMYTTLVDTYPDTHVVVEKITIYLEDIMKYELTDEEKLYLMLHVNRLCTREDYENTY